MGDVEKLKWWHPAMVEFRTRHVVHRCRMWPEELFERLNVADKIEDLQEFIEAHPDVHSEQSNGNVIRSNIE